MAQTLDHNIVCHGIRAKTQLPRLLQKAVRGRKAAAGDEDVEEGVEGLERPGTVEARNAIEEADCFLEERRPPVVLDNGDEELLIAANTGTSEAVKDRVDGGELREVSELVDEGRVGRVVVLVPTLLVVIEDSDGTLGGSGVLDLGEDGDGPSQWLSWVWLVESLIEVLPVPGARPPGEAFTVET